MEQSVRQEGLPPGWRVADPLTDGDLSGELASEVPDGHVLRDVAVSPVAVRGSRGGPGRKDVLVWAPDMSRWALVHLTWSTKQMRAGHRRL